MGRKAKFSFETKLAAVMKYLEGESSASYEASQLGISSSRVLEWISLYQSLGKEGLKTTSKNTVYSAMLKENAASDYLLGKGSYADICKKYGIRSSCQLRQWILKYNGHEKLKASGTGGLPIMAKGRRTTYDERVEIVKYCIEHQDNYTETAQKYKVSYQQVYTWCKKYEIRGVEALQDKRGCKKPESEMSELEKLRAENKLLKAENRRKELENLFLKKLDEIERRRY